MATEVGFEDIYSDDAYFDIEQSGKQLLIHLLYVPPVMRGNGIGKALFEKLLREISPEVEFIRLKACVLGSGCTINYWKSLGFSHAYTNCDPEEEGRILHRAVNGFSLPAVERLEEGETRHYIFD